MSKVLDLGYYHFLVQFIFFCFVFLQTKFAISVGFLCKLFPWSMRISVNQNEECAKSEHEKRKGRIIFVIIIIIIIIIIIFGATMQNKIQYMI